MDTRTRAQKLYHEALERGWILCDAIDEDDFLFADGFGSKANVSLIIGRTTAWIETPQGDVGVALKTFTRLPSPKAAADFIATLR